VNLEYEIKRSARRRKLTITVERDRRVIVHAPLTTTEEKIRTIVDSKRQWLFDKINHRQKYPPALQAPGKELVNGESALYMGQNYKIKIAQTNSGEIELSDSFAIPEAIARKGSGVFVAWYIARAEEVILSRAKHYAQQLNVDCQSVKIVDNKFRWGSCTLNKNISFNWRLIKAPMPVINYVVVHELAHLIEASHSTKFWNIVKAQIAYSEKSKEWLKKFGDVLEQEL